MADLQYVVQQPGDGATILRGYRDLASSVPFNRLTGLYAFASAKGVRLFTEAMIHDVSNWRSVAKRWVISIDGGVTEPDALRALLRHPNVEVRVPDAEPLLERSLRPIHRFHPKTLLLEAGAAHSPAGIIVGSANLTCNGLCFGHEHALIAKLSGPDPTLQVGIDRLSSITVDATEIDSAFVDRYEEVRPARPQPREEFEDRRADNILQDRSVIPATEAAALASARNFWIDIEYVVANRGRHEEGNQIDMKRGTRVFFGFGDGSLPRNSPIGTVRIRYETHSARRNLRFGNNSMDKLDLPIPDQEGPPSYSHQTLLFTREDDGSFRLTVGDATDIATWKARSREMNTLFAMRSGREYGVF